MLNVVKLSVIMLNVAGSKDAEQIPSWVFDNIKKFQYKKVKTKAALTRPKFRRKNVGDGHRFERITRCKLAIISHM